MWNLKACIVCFSTDVKLYSLNVGTLRKDFNLVSGLKVIHGNGMPEYLCVECTAYVQKFKKFQYKCHRAHYALEQILTQNKEIKKCYLAQFDCKQIGVAPTLSYMSLDRINYTQMRSELVNHSRIRTQHGSFPVAHYSAPANEDFELEMGNVMLEKFRKEIKTEFETGTDLSKYEINRRNILPHVNSTTNNMMMDQNGDDFHDYDDETDAEREKFEPVSCKLNNKVDGVSHSIDCGDVVPMSIKEAKAAVEVYKYTSVGPYQCHCGKAFVVEKNFKTHSRRHDLHISGTYHCEICDYYFKTAFLLQSHMSDQHMYKYLCKICPEVSFTKPSAKQHYMSHIKLEGGESATKNKAKKPSWITPSVRGGVRVKGVCKDKPKKTTKKQPKDFPVYSPQTPLEQYQMVQQRKESRNYLEAKFKCELCYRGYRLTSTYNKHMAKHDSSKSGIHQCDMCKHFFRDTRRLYKHMIMYHVYKYSCQACDFVTTNKGQAIYHYRWHKNVTYDCPHCDKKFNKITTQMTHIRFKHPGTDICNICGHSFISSSGVKYHKLIAHTKEEIELSEAIELNPDTSSPFHCAECRMQFVTEQAHATHLGSSKKHVEINVSSQSVMKCKSRASRAEPAGGGEAAALGGAGAPRARRAASQVLNTGVTTPSHCNVCGIFLGSDVVARRHYEAEHPGTDYLKRYMCDVCGHTTKQFANLLVHMRTHTREKPYPCPHCDRRFSMTSNRDRHLVWLVHSREKPYPCPHCDRRFSMTSNRDRHLVVHTGEKRFQCQHCSRRFTQSTAVKLHIQTVHMKIPYKPWDKKNRKRRKEAQLNAQGTEVVPAPEAVVAPAPPHKLIIDPQGEFITYIYTHEQ